MKYLKTLVAVLLFLAGLTSTASAQTATAAQYMQAGNTAYGSKNYDQAIQYYQAATTLDPNYGPAYQGLGNCYYFKGDNASALKNYEKALSFDPNNASLNSFVQSLRAKVGSAPAAPAGSMTASPAAAAYSSTAATAGSPSKFELGLNAGVAVASNVTGFGGGANGFMMLDKNFGLGAMVNFYTFGQSASGYGASASASTNFIEILAGVKYKFDGNGFRPYIFGGVGIADIMETETVTYLGVSQSVSASEMDPMIQIGGGAEFSMGPGMNFFVQGKYSDVLSTVSNSYEPIEGGINFSL